MVKTARSTAQSPNVISSISYRRNGFFPSPIARVGRLEGSLRGKRCSPAESNRMTPQSNRPTAISRSVRSCVEDSLAALSLFRPINSLTPQLCKSHRIPIAFLEKVSFPKRRQPAASISSAIASILTALFRLRAVPVVLSSFSTEDHGSFVFPMPFGK